MKPFNICLVQPEKYIHSYAFLELGELLLYSLRDLKCEASLRFNEINAGYQNIIIGCHLLNPRLIGRIPKSTIILNTEQIYADTKKWSANIFAWTNKFEVWDYSIRNIEKFEEIGINNVKHLKLGYQRQLRRIQKNPVKDIDVLFYGSRNERRNKILHDLEASGLKVKVLFGIYGKERDEFIARSKLVLNHHFYESHIFEVVRVFYLLSNSVAVVGEVSKTTSIDSMYKDAICSSPYEGLVDNCLALASDRKALEDLEAKAFEVISAYPQSQFTAEVLQQP